MSISDVEKKNYIKNNFHQYFDLTLNLSINTAEAVNLVIPIDLLREEKDNSDIHFEHTKTYPEGYDIKEILGKYEESNILKTLEEGEKLTKCFLRDNISNPVIDGDTFHVKIPYVENTVVKYSYEKVRLVGVNTPEVSKNEVGATVSRDFLKKALESTDKIYLKIDKEKERDSYGRLLAVVFVDNKNINEIMLKEGLAEIWYIPPSEFNPYDWISVDDIVGEIPVHLPNFKNTDISILSPYFNSDMTNIVFTPQNDYDTLHRFEVYQGVIYIKLKPYSRVIRMHLLPKIYDCSNTLLLFKDSNITMNKSLTNDYKHFPEESSINSYYIENNVIRDRTSPDISSQTYDPNQWSNTFNDFSYDISQSTRSLSNLQICAGYRYNNSTPFYSIHYTGVRDNTNPAIEDRCTLIDANYDKIESTANNITQYHYNEQTSVLYIPKKPNADILSSYNKNIDHISQEKITNLHHKTIKYINDLLYSEEYCKDCGTTEADKRPHTSSAWIDISR